MKKNRALIEVIKVKVLDDCRLELQFDDGACGEVDISKLISFTGIFARLRDKQFFSRVTINPDIGTICWENGADLSPAYLRQHIQKQK